MFAILAGCLGLLFGVTNPENLPVAIFILVFLVLYGLSYSLIALLGLGAHNVGLIRWEHKKIERTAAFAAVLPVFLLVLQSIGQLTARDVLLAVGLFGLLFMYISRAAMR